MQGSPVSHGRTIYNSYSRAQLAAWQRRGKQDTCRLAYVSSLCQVARAPQESESSSQQPLSIKETHTHTREKKQRHTPFLKEGNVSQLGLQMEAAATWQADGNERNTLFM